MKFQVDLLPLEYKSLPRDTTSIIIAFAVFVAIFGACVSRYLMTRKTVAEIEQQVRALSLQVSEVNNKIKALAVPSARVDSIKNKVEKLKTTVMKKNFSWVLFLDNLENSVPGGRLWISGLQKEEAPGKPLQVHFNGEASDNSTVLEFQENLARTAYFKGVEIRSTNKKAGGDGEIIDFKISAQVSESL